MADEGKRAGGAREAGSAGGAGATGFAGHAGGEAHLTHVGAGGEARMVDVGAKRETAREAAASARVLLDEATFELVRAGGAAKGDVVGTARVAGFLAAKRVPDLIPMCHPVLLDGVDMDVSLNARDRAVEITATARCTGRTGVEMEALTAACVAALTVYDMCKAAQKDIVIDQVRLLRKSGGKSGDYEWRPPDGGRRP